MLMKDIPDGLLEEIVRRLVDGLSPEKIILFGSHAYGYPDENSDIDLLVIISQSGEPRPRVTPAAPHPPARRKPARAPARLRDAPESGEPRHRRASKAYSCLWGITAPVELIVLTRQEIEQGLKILTSLVSQAIKRGKILYG